jgi:hypothetical protein
MEIWMKIEGHEGYEISNFGRVRTKRITRLNKFGLVRRFKILHPALTRGYRRLMTPDRKLVLVHKLVLAAFVGPCPEGMEANHKNGIKDDNRLENLEYVTRNENQWHATHVLGKRGHIRGSVHGRSKLNEEQVKEIRRLEAEGNHTRKQLSEMFTISQQMLSFIISKRNWKHI